MNIGRKTRVVPAAIKRAVWARDRGCRFPGCGRKRYVDAHHVKHWSAGGETSLDNLMLLCPEHHRLVHEGGFRIEKDYRDRWFFKRLDGRAVPACGYRWEDTTDIDVDSADEYFTACVSAETFAGSAASEETIFSSAETLRASAETWMVREGTGLYGALRRLRSATNHQNHCQREHGTYFGPTSTA